MSLKFPQICLKDEKKFEGMLSQYCEKGPACQKSKVDNSNYGLFNIVSDMDIWMQERMLNLHNVTGIVLTP